MFFVSNFAHIARTNKTNQLPAMDSPVLPALTRGRVPRYFLRQIVNRVVEIKGRKLADYVGDYNYYLEQNLEARRKELEREAELEAAAPKIKSQSKMTRVSRVR